MYPLLGTERARQDIAQTFEQYDLNPNMRKMIATRILPPFNVQLAHGTYPVLPLKQLMKRVDTAGANASGYAARRSPRGTYNRNDLAFTQAAYNTEEHGLEGVVDRNESVHYASHFDHEVTTAQKVLHDVMLERELRTAALLFSTTEFIPGVSGQSQDAGTYREDGTTGAAVKWNDYANATPIRDLFVAKTKVWQKFGCYPDCMVINETTFRHLRRCEQIRQEWIAQGAGSRAYQDMIATFDESLEGLHRNITITAISQVLDIPEIVVGCSIMDANNSNDAAFASQHVWGNSALVFKKVRGSGGAALREVGLGHTLQWTPDTNNDPTVSSVGLDNSAGFFVEEYWEPQVRGQVIRVRHQDRQLLKYKTAELITSVY